MQKNKGKEISVYGHKTEHNDWLWRPVQGVEQCHREDVNGTKKEREKRNRKKRERKR